MKYICVSVYDRAAEAFGRPVFTQSLGAAIRSFGDEINRSAADNEMNRHPKDFDLFHVGSFDDSTGEFETFKPMLLVSGTNIANQAKS